MIRNADSRRRNARNGRKYASGIKLSVKVGKTVYLIYLIYTECLQIYLIADPQDSEVRRRLALVSLER
eukprot:COSAG06_NODE_4110_length_4565_cov_25.062696_7_plen_68_part_00